MSRPVSPVPVEEKRRTVSRRTAHSVQKNAKFRLNERASAEAERTELKDARVVLGMSKGSGRMSKLIIDPRVTRWISAWDVATGTALMFVALITPIEVGFLDPSTTWLDPLFLINQVINLVFVLDLVLQFFLMVPITDAFGTRWVSDSRVIARHYLAGWFGIDLLSIAVSAVDYISLSNIFGGENQESLDNLRTLRVLRALRLVKLSKLLTGQRIIKRWETKVAMNYSAISLLKCLVGTLLLSHWFACVWGLQASFAVSKIDTWLGGYDLCTLEADGVTEVCKGAGYKYSAAIYWAVMTMTSIGYGDISATPGNIAEHLICTAIMAFGAMSWGMVLGTIVSNLSSLDPDGDKFAQTMSELNMMMLREDLPNEMRIRLREYFQQTVHVRFTQQRSELLSTMSPSLRTEVVWQCNREWLSRIWFLKGASVPFLVQLSLKLTAQVFAPGEVAPRGRMYIVHRGVALYGGKVYGGGRVWGEDVILTSEHLQKEFSARAMIFLSVFSLSRDDLEDVCSLFPVEWLRIRRAAIQLATRRAFVAEAHRRVDAKVGSTTAGTGKQGRSDGGAWLAAKETIVKGMPVDDADDEVRETFQYMPADRRRANGRPPSNGRSPSPGSSLISDPPRVTPEPRGGHLSPSIHSAASASPMSLIFPTRGDPLLGQQGLLWSGAAEAPEPDSGAESSELRPLVEAILTNSRRLAEQMEAYEEAQTVIERTLNHQCTDLAAIADDVQRLRQQVAGNALSGVFAKLRA